jgi:hypothetical protein
MKTIKITLVALVAGVAFVSCNKEECSDCHYYLNSTETVELGEKCGDELSTLESNGIAVGDTLYEEHCHGH